MWVRRRRDRSSWAILRADEGSPFTLVSHDGKEGWIESASGGLSFHAGSLSRSRDGVPHLRLTAEGNLGIGVMEPTAKLDVAGLIRASDGIQFGDGTVLKMEGGYPVLATDSSQVGPGVLPGCQREELPHCLRGSVETWAPSTANTIGISMRCG